MLLKKMLELPTIWTLFELQSCFKKEPIQGDVVEKLIYQMCKNPHPNIVVLTPHSRFVQQKLGGLSVCLDMKRCRLIYHLRMKHDQTFHSLPKEQRRDLLILYPLQLLKQKRFRFHCLLQYITWIGFCE